jgi:hypothetical protein
MKTFDKPYIRILDHLLGREKHFFFPNSQYLIFRLRLVLELKRDVTS